MVGDRKLQRRNVFPQRPSPALSYVIGANIGDGCTLTKNWIVKLEVTDLDFAQTFNANMATLFDRAGPNKILVKRFKVERLPMYVVRYSSKQLVELLRQPIKKVLELAFAFPREFLRGFFDAEGHVDVGITGRLDLFVGAENSDKLLLSMMKQLLKGRLGINSNMNRKRMAGSIKVIRGKSFVMRRTSFSLVIRRISDLKRFAEEVGFSISRKTQKLNDALSIIATFDARSRPRAWQQLYSKVRGEWVRRDLSRLG